MESLKDPFILKALIGMFCLALTALIFAFYLLVLKPKQDEKNISRGSKKQEDKHLFDEADSFHSPN